MQDNIESKNIGNRKIVLEIRFKTIASILDKKGILADKYVRNKIFANTHWEIGNSDLVLRDNVDKNESKNLIVITPNLYSYISSKVDSVESFYAKFEAIRRIFEEEIQGIQILRIGCRIIGSYYTKSDKFDKVLNGFISKYPDSFLFDKYKAEDMSFQLVYKNGRYSIGPLSEDDPLYDREFPSINTKRHVGFCIDTDNFVTNIIKDINSEKLYKEIFQLSLSVEKNLYDNLSNLE